VSSSSFDQDFFSLLQGFNSGNATARAELFSLLYEELRTLAAGYMSRQGPEHTLQATALVSEAYMRLQGPRQTPCLDRKGFLFLVAHVMRCVLIDHARKKGRSKRQLPGVQTPIDEVVFTLEDRSIELEALDAALKKLQSFDPVMAKAVELRFFAGLDVAETAEVLGMSKRAFERQWRTIRNWLYLEVQACA
jgi:RNA polymerase sigma factor (TIGR02999 family)